jgi:hypothetical protein
MSQVLPGFLITPPPSLCVPAVLGALAVWIQPQKKKKVLSRLCIKHKLQEKKKC